MIRWFTRATSEPPSAPGAVTRVVEGDHWRVRLDLAPQVLSLEIPPRETDWRSRAGELSPVCPGTGFVSASMLAVKAKLFDDGLYAAAELMSQPSKAALLSALARLSPTVTAAARLGGIAVDETPEARDLAAAFLDDERASKPLGFYTWHEELARIFRQDRMLQSELEANEAAALAFALRADPPLGEAYARHLDFVARLTNALSPDKPDLRRPGGRHFFPPSRSHESDLAARLYGLKPIPPGFSLAREMLKALRAGEIDLGPTPASGWYDMQTWALEPLALLETMPEGVRLRTNDRYREQLDELFQAVLSLTRETHVKQLDCPTIGAAMGRLDAAPIAWIQPGLTVEPLRSYYARRAETYDFVRALLERDGRLGAMRRHTEDGPVQRPLADELAEMAALFRGAAAVAGQELGMEPAPAEATAPFTRFAEQHAQGGSTGRSTRFHQDPGPAEDIRMMVPVFHDVGRDMTKVWAILGWDVRELNVSFSVPPAARVLKGRAEVRFGSESHALAYPVFAEAYVARLLDRDEFRAHCDRYKTVERILAHL